MGKRCPSGRHGKEYHGWCTMGSKPFISHDRCIIVIVLIVIHRMSSAHSSHRCCYDLRITWIDRTSDIETSSTPSRVICIKQKTRRKRERGGKKLAKLINSDRAFPKSLTPDGIQNPLLFFSLTICKHSQSGQHTLASTSAWHSSDPPRTNRKKKPWLDAQVWRCVIRH